MNFKDLQWHIPSIHGIYHLKIQDINDGYRYSKGIWNGLGFQLLKDKLNSNEFIEYFRFGGIIRS